MTPSYPDNVALTSSKVQLKDANCCGDDSGGVGAQEIERERGPGVFTLHKARKGPSERGFITIKHGCPKHSCRRANLASLPDGVAAKVTRAGFHKPLQQNCNNCCNIIIITL